MTSHHKPNNWVFVVDDDPQIRRSMERLLLLAGHNCRTFNSAIDYLSATLEPFDAACLVLDIRMPQMTGLELQQRLPGTRHEVPIVFVSAYGDIPTCVKTLKAGAVSFIAKPFEGKELLQAVSEALQESSAENARHSEQSALRANFALLTPREREIFRLVTQGLLNKQIAAELGIAEITVKIHRAHVMSKMGVKSVADLVRLAAALE